MKCPPEYWIWLQRTLGAGKRCDEMLMYFDDPMTLYEAGKKEWLNSGTIGIKTADMLTRYSPSQSYGIMKQCSENGWKIITYDDENYPERLREIYGFPVVLYVDGDESVLNSPVCISMVGTRNASEYGVNVAYNLAGSLAKAGAVIVSGGALGIDRASHLGAMDSHGKTIAFLGCGLGNSYLASNKELRDRISQNGAVVSEYPPYSSPTRQSFPIRNRLISGLGLGTIVIEAGEKSGSLITARFALEQGRDVFAVPGDVTSSNYFGTNNLIRDGARAVFSYMDVLDGYIGEYGDYIKTDDKYVPLKSTVKARQRIEPVRQLSWKTTGSYEKKDNTIGNGKQKEEKNKNLKIHEEIKIQKNTANNTEQEKRESQKVSLPDYATESATTVYKIMTAEEKTPDDYVAETGLSVSEILSALTELELYGAISHHNGNRYSLKS